MSRTASRVRQTHETDIDMHLTINEYGVPGKFTGTTGVGFFDHMMTSLAFHGGFVIDLKMTGDTHVDCHHTIEDVGIVLGGLFAEILGDRSGIVRFGDRYIPMDETLAFCAIDICGRGFSVCDVSYSSPMIGDYDTQMTTEFFRALAMNMGAALHLRVIYGENDHHKTEALFKACAKTIADAVAQNRDGTALSSKGSLA
jgi:Imidazoleglycerol-phosphate dehydratase